ncbi:MAG: 30S ribosomal protein S11 [Patescibacteria group bacterium]
MGKKRIIAKGASAPEGEGETRTRSVVADSGRRVSTGIAHIRATYNNTIISVTDTQGNVLGWSSSGSVGFSGTKKATPYAAARVAEFVADKAKRAGLTSITVRVAGVGAGRDSAVRSLANHGLLITGIKDVTPIPHNGPRPPKVRRV